MPLRCVVGGVAADEVGASDSVSSVKQLQYFFLQLPQFAARKLSNIRFPNGSMHMKKYI
jgi:hypothetical protein